MGVEEGRVNGWKGPLEGALADAWRSPVTETEPAALVWGAWMFLSSPLYLTAFLRTDLGLCMESNQQPGTPCSLEPSFTGDVDSLTGKVSLGECAGRAMFPRLILIE